MRVSAQEWAPQTSLDRSGCKDLPVLATPEQTVENSKLVQYGRGSKACTVTGTAKFKGSETKALTEIGMPRFLVFFSFLLPSFPSSPPPHFSFWLWFPLRNMFANSVAQTAPHRLKMAKKGGDARKSHGKREEKERKPHIQDSESPQLSLFSYFLIFFSFPPSPSNSRPRSSASCNV